MSNVALTPDGRGVVLQEEPADRRREFGEKTNVWLWDFSTQRGQCLAVMPEIEAVHGWAGREFLLLTVEGTLEGTRPYQWSTSDSAWLRVVPTGAAED